MADSALGAKIRALRKEHHLTLTDLSEKAGVAIATLSRIETGRMRGTIDSHRQIASALGLPVTELYRQLDATQLQVVVKRRGEKGDTFLHGASVLSEFLTTNVLRKKMMPLLMHVPPGARTPLEETPGGIEKFVYILDGELDVTVGKETTALKTGDGLYFEASLPHHVKNRTARPARCLCILSPPHL